MGVDSYDEWKPNPDAVYAGMVYAREWLGRPEVKAQAADANERADASWAGIIPGGSVRAILRPKITPELCESIFPSEPDSVEYGIRIACFILFGPDPELGERLASNDEECTHVFRRFLADAAIKH